MNERMARIGWLGFRLIHRIIVEPDCRVTFEIDEGNDQGVSESSMERVSTEVYVWLCCTYSRDVETHPNTFRSIFISICVKNARE